MDNEKMAKFHHLENAMKSMTFSAKYLAEKAYSEIGKSVDIDFHKTAATAFVNQASAYMSSAYAIYHSNIDFLEHYDIDPVFTKFFSFAEELLKSFSENHSYQHTFIYFDDFKESFESSCLNVPIEE